MASASRRQPSRYAPPKGPSSGQANAACSPRPEPGTAQRPARAGSAWLDRLVGDGQVVARIALQIAPLAIVEHLAHPAPVNRHPVARRGVFGKASPVNLTQNALRARGV